MSVEFNTREYRFSHGKEPAGRGSWAFKLPGNPDLVWHNGTYSEAKKAARQSLIERARKLGMQPMALHETILVMP